MTPAGTPQERPKPFEIVINGKMTSWEKREISYEELVSLAFNGSPPKGPNVVITVLYTKADEKKPSGSLIKGQSVKVKDGTTFDVTATDRS